MTAITVASGSSELEFYLFTLKFAYYSPHGYPWGGQNTSSPQYACWGLEVERRKKKERGVGMLRVVHSHHIDNPTVGTTFHTFPFLFANLNKLLTITTYQ
jgi:hypothetical protein